MVSDFLLSRYLFTTVSVCSWKKKRESTSQFVRCSRICLALSSHSCLRICKSTAILEAVFPGRGTYFETSSETVQCLNDEMSMIQGA